MNILVTAIGLYIAFQMMADIASLKIIMIAGFSMDAGTLIYPITFTVRDIIHKIAGKKIARLVIVLAGTINLVMALFFWIVSLLPSDMSAGSQIAFSSVLSPVWNIVFASIVAELLSEIIDTEAYHFFVTKITTKYQWARVLFSNSISIPIDSFVFCFLAFSYLPIGVIFAIFMSNVIVKFICTFASLPLIYLAKEKEWNTPGL